MDTTRTISHTRSPGPTQASREMSDKKVTLIYRLCYHAVASLESKLMYDEEWTRRKRQLTRAHPHQHELIEMSDQKGDSHVQTVLPRCSFLKSKVKEMKNQDCKTMKVGEQCNFHLKIGTIPSNTYRNRYKKRKFKVDITQNMAYTRSPSQSQTSRKMNDKKVILKYSLCYHAVSTWSQNEFIKKIKLKDNVPQIITHPRSPTQHTPTER